MTSHGVTSPTPMVWDHTRSAPTTTTPSSSIQSRGIRNTTFLPISSILRPIFPVPLDQAKVASMLDTLARSNSSPQSASCGLNGDPLPDKLPPIDVLSYKSKKTGREFYFAFGGCHRLSAYERAEKEMVECKVLRVTRGMLGGYLGSSLGAILGEDE
ncbi:ParB/Sulfiredoxin [Kalaharituber pfeilii]|nr:ParB/Sulfiredoxin [Kalaharituber pfeilii]